jgi:hypothetical protein
MHISIQAVIVAVVYFLILAIGFYHAILTATFSLWTAIIFLISLGFALLFIHDTNCLTKGECNWWSSIRTGLFLILPVVLIIIIIVAFFRGKKVSMEPPTSVQMMQPMMMSQDSKESRMMSQESRMMPPSQESRP